MIGGDALLMVLPSVCYCDRLTTGVDGSFVPIATSFCGDVYN